MTKGGQALANEIQALIMRAKAKPDDILFALTACGYGMSVAMRDGDQYMGRVGSIVEQLQQLEARRR